MKKRERVSKSVLCANATKRIVAFPDRLSTIRFMSTKRIVEKVAPQTVLLNSGEERGLDADSRSETKGRSVLFWDDKVGGVRAGQLVIGASLSEPHTSELALQFFLYVCM